MPLLEDTTVLRSDFRLHNVSLKRCTKVRHEYEVIQSSEVYGNKTPTCEDLADASQHCLPLLRPYSSRRNVLRQDRPGSGPGKENMNPEDGTELCHKKAISCDRPSMRSSMRYSTRMTCESRYSLAMAHEPQVEPQQRTLTSTKIVRCRRRADAGLTQFPYQQSSRPSKGTAQTQVRYGPEQSKDEIIPWNRAEARQKKKQPCSKMASRPTSGSAAHLTPTILAPPNVLYSSLGPGNCRPGVSVGTWLDNLESLTVDIANSVLDHNRLGRVCAEPYELRKSLFTLCKNQSCILLYRRHKDSLKHAALSIPQESTQRASLIKTSIRLQGLFINLWTKSYDPIILLAAVEVVIGCKLTEFINLSGVSSQDFSIEGKRQANKEIERLTESSFPRNSDSSCTGRACVTISSIECARSWQQIVLESLMLIHMLDTAKVQGIFLPNLFIDSSCFKSTHLSLKELPTLLLPFLGDLYRLLARLRYLTSCVQVALGEYHFPVTIITIDLRDALRFFTRLLESLLSPDDPKSRCDAPDGEEAIQIQTSGSLEDQDTTASIEVPCLRRSSKIHNAQIALNAMRGTGGAGSLIGSLKG